MDLVKQSFIFPDNYDGFCRDQSRVNRSSKNFIANKFYHKTSQPSGKGSFGEVRVFLYDNDVVAGKKINVQSKSDELEIAKEIYILKQLNESETNQRKKFIPIYKDCVQLKSYKMIFIIMEKLYVDLQKGALEFRKKFRNNKDRQKKYLDFAKGVQVLAFNNLVHSDLKPANIMATPNFETIKIIDFGKTVKVGSKIERGTPYYEAPEKYSSKNRTSLTQDVWAFGLIIASIEAGNHIHVFKQMVDSCFLKGYSSNKNCHKQLKSNVMEIMKDKFPLQEQFQHVETYKDCRSLTCLVMFCIALNPRERPNINYIVDFLGTNEQNDTHSSDDELKNLQNQLKVVQQKSILQETLSQADFRQIGEFQQRPQDNAEGNENVIDEQEMNQKKKFIKNRLLDRDQINNQVDQLLQDQIELDKAKQGSAEESDEERPQIIDERPIKGMNPSQMNIYQLDPKEKQKIKDENDIKNIMNNVHKVQKQIGQMEKPPVHTKLNIPSGNVIKERQYGEDIDFSNKYIAQGKQINREVNQIAQNQVNMKQIQPKEKQSKYQYNLQPVRAIHQENVQAVHQINIEQRPNKPRPTSNQVLKRKPSLKKKKSIIQPQKQSLYDKYAQPSIIKQQQQAILAQNKPSIIQQQPQPIYAQYKQRVIDYGALEQKIRKELEEFQMARQNYSNKYEQNLNNSSDEEVVVSAYPVQHNVQQKPMNKKHLLI